MLAIVNVTVVGIWILLSFFEDCYICFSRQLMYLLIKLVSLRIVFKLYEGKSGVSLKY